MTTPDPLDALWQADEPPAKDHAFTAGTVARLATGDRRIEGLRRALTGLGVGGAVAGAVLLAPSGLDGWTIVLVGAAMAGALMAGARLIA